MAWDVISSSSLGLLKCLDKNHEAEQFQALLGIALIGWKDLQSFAGAGTWLSIIIKAL